MKEYNKRELYENIILDYNEKERLKKQIKNKNIFINSKFFFFYIICFDSFYFYIFFKYFNKK